MSEISDKFNSINYMSDMSDIKGNMSNYTSKCAPYESEKKYIKNECCEINIRHLTSIIDYFMDLCIIIVPLPIIIDSMICPLIKIAVLFATFTNLYSYYKSACNRHNRLFANILYLLTVIFAIQGNKMFYYGTDIELKSTALYNEVLADANDIETQLNLKSNIIDFYYEYSNNKSRMEICRNLYKDSLFCENVFEIMTNYYFIQSAYNLGYFNIGLCSIITNIFYLLYIIY